MNASALSLVLAASLGWAALDALRKRLVREVEPLLLLLMLTLVQVPLFGAWGAASGFGAGGPRLPDGRYWVPALCSVALNVGANLAFLHAMRMAPLSATVPLLSLTPVFTTLISVPLLGERPTAVQAAGVLLVVAGALGLHPGLLSKVRGGAALPAAGLMLLTALLWSAATPLDKLAVEHAGAPLHGLVLNGGVALGVLVVGLIGLAWRAARAGTPAGAGSGEPRPAGARWGAAGRLPGGTLAAAMALSFLAMALQLLALSKAPAGFVETVKRGVGNASAVAVGSALFGERVGGRTLAAVLVMVAGVAAILL
jgi:drug/metabolite transporter (DMT)-like permease